MFIDFFNFIKSYEIFFLFETYVTIENTSKFTNYFNGFKLYWIPAVKTSLRGRASGGCLYGIKISQLNNYDFMEFHDTVLVNMKSKRNMFILPLYLNCNKWSEDFEILSNIMSLLSDKSILLVGDFNARISCSQVTTLMNNNNSRISPTSRISKDNICNQNGTNLLELLQLYDSIILNGCTNGDTEGQFTFIGGQGKSVIDYCAINNEWLDHIRKFEVLSKHFSDHMPITVECTTETNVHQRNLDLIPRMKWCKQNVHSYQQSLDEYISRILTTPETCEGHSNQIIQCIRNSSNTGQKNPIKTFKQKWFDRECMNARQKTFDLLNAMRRNPYSNELRRWYIRSNTMYKQLCLSKKINYETIQALSIAQTNNTKDFWKIAKEINGLNHIIGAGVSADDLSVYFMNLLQNKSNLTFSYAEPLICDDTLDCIISIDEIQTILRKAKNDKAPGEDGIPYEFFKCASPSFNNYLLTFFNKVLKSAEIPESFKTSVIFPIHKKGALNVVENYRGISFMNVIAKIFCGVLVGRLERWADQNNIISDLQAGFRKSYSTIDHIFSLTSIVKAFQARNKKVFAFFVDFKAAFDLVNRSALLYKLSELGVSTRFLRVIRNMYTDTKSTVWDGEMFSQWFNTDTGVKQGCPLSALLFSLFINDIVKHLPGGIRIANTIINVLLYADDLVVLSESPENLQLMINRLAAYCEKWGLTINTEKSKVMVFSRTNQRDVNHRWFFRDSCLDVANEHKYLGVKLNSTLDFRKHLTEKSNASQSLINLTWKKLFLNPHINLSVKYKIFEAVLRSSLCYAAQVWGVYENEEIEKLQRNFIKKLFNLPVTTPNYALYLETGLPKLFTYTLKLHADFIIKVLRYPDSRLSKKLLLYEVRNKDWWIQKWQNLSGVYGEEVNFDVSNHQLLKTQLYKIIQKQEDSVRNRMIVEAYQSQSRILYSQLEYNLCEKNYFSNSLSCKEISLIFKTRCELLRLNGRPYNESFNQFCTLCNLKAKEDCFHLLSICPIYKQYRRRYFGKPFLTMEETKHVLNGQNWKDLERFLKETITFRMLLITEYA